MEFACLFLWRGKVSSYIFSATEEENLFSLSKAGKARENERERGKILFNLTQPDALIIFLLSKPEEQKHVRRRKKIVETIFSTESLYF